MQSTAQASDNNPDVTSEFAVSLNNFADDQLREVLNHEYELSQLLDPSEASTSVHEHAMKLSAVEAEFVTRMKSALAVCQRP